MKTKRLAIILSVLIFLTIIIVLCSAVFTVQNISVNWLTKPNVLTVDDNEDIISSSKIKMNSSVFTLKKQQYIENIEKSKSYIEVVKIEVKFPNKVVIHAREREPYFYLNLGNSDYAILDKELKVLELTNDLQNYIKLFGISPCELAVDSSMIANLNLSRGDFLNIAYTSMFKGITEYLQELNYDTLKAKNTFKTFMLKNNNLYIYTNLGLNIYINNVNDNLNKKLLYGVSAYEQYKDSYSTGTIVCYSNNFYLTNEDISKCI